MTDRDRERALDRPRRPHALQQRLGKDTRPCGPLTDGERLAVIGQAMIIALVVSLFGASGPTDISRSVGAVVVDAIKRVVGSRPQSHIVQKQLERVAPFLAHRDPTTAIVREIRTVRVVAPSLGVAPCAVFRRFRMCVAVTKSQALALGKGLGWAPLTTARFRCATPQMIQLDDAFTSAVAPTQKTAIAMIHPGSFSDDLEMCESLADVNRAGAHCGLNYIADRAA